uniref:Uncharacterized protein n=1 Tax=Parascaris univalens TaxID=6257 RepID=A0A915A3R5_PARUN
MRADGHDLAMSSCAGDMKIVGRARIPFRVTSTGIFDDLYPPFRTGGHLWMEETSTAIRLSAAAAYGICSILIVFVNKILLTNLRFPSFLCAGIGQMLATVSILFVASSFRIVSVPSFDRSIPRK